MVESSSRWLNRNVVGMGITSFLSDAGHEMVTSVLPSFLTTMGFPAAALGIIEGVADGIASFVRLIAGWYSDRTGRRKTATVIGYFMTGITTGLLGLAWAWTSVLVLRSLAWFGRGLRGPLRDAMLADSVPAVFRGRAFGFHRACDTLGAIVGPLVAVGALALYQPNQTANSLTSFRFIFWLALIPGVVAALSFALLVSERITRRENKLGFGESITTLPAPFRRILIGVALFGLGDFAPAMSILAATQLLSPQHGVVSAAKIAGLLYVLRNTVYALSSFPIGAFSDRVSRRTLLAVGYIIGAIATAGIGMAFGFGLENPIYLMVIFAFTGISVASQDTLERAITADFVESEKRGAAYGLLASVNGIGDLLSSAILGLLWTLISPTIAFTYAALIMLAGAMVVALSGQRSLA